MGHVYEFGQFRLHETAGKLTRGDDELHLTAKGFATLLHLVERAGTLVPKDELLDRIWPDGFVEPANLTQTIYVLRKTLDDADAQIIETVPGRGYRFAPSVQVASEPEYLIPAPGHARQARPILRLLWPAFAAVIALVLMALRSSAPSAGQSSFVSMEAHRDTSSAATTGVSGRIPERCSPCAISKPRFKVARDTHRRIRVSLTRTRSWATTVPRIARREPERWQWLVRQRCGR